jgi:pyruvate dehydrogenase E2 component (dihydrolipoamide acetyltransferase)
MNVLMPQLGETVAEGKITKWFKSAGDAVKPGDNLFEIETDKVSMEVPATTAGVLSEIRIGTGEVAPVGAVVAVIAGEGATTKSAPFVPAQGGTQSQKPQPSGQAALGPRLRGDERNLEAGATQQAQARAAPMPLDPFFEVRTPERNYGPAKLPGETFVTPLARRLAAEGGIDLGGISPSSPHGRIVARDVTAALAAKPSTAARAHGPSAHEVLALYRDVPHEEMPLDAMRSTIAARLVQAKQSIPHFYLTADVEIGKLLALREEANAAASSKLSINDFIIKAWAAALMRVPAANAVWAEDRILRLQRADIAVAVAIEGGLITPVIRTADAKPLSAIAAEMRGLAARARERKLRPDEYQGGSSAISNLGMYGVREFAAIINPPHATILAIGAARRQAVEKPDGSVGFASVMTVTLSCDHRVVDGALGAQLLAAFKGYVEQPVTMLV